MESENKTIARNSLLLYMRTFLIMIITLYTVRVTLKILGFVDYGIYNTVGGVIAIFAFLSNTLTSVSQRYFSFFLGKNDVLRLRQLFNSLLIIYTTIAVGIAVIAELSGSWLINNYLTIPADRIGATMWIYHFSILTLVINFIQIPYNSVIISRERMSIYAYLSILEVLLKLLVVFLLFYITFDSLILYSILLLVVAVIKLGIYAIYSTKKFPECKLQLYWQRDTYKELTKYLGWNILGVFSAVIKAQGIVVVINSFFGPIVNTAFAIANQIYSAVNQFVSSFLLAVQPQIVKKYAEGNKERMFELVFLSSKYSYYLLMIVVIPCIIELPYILNIWLGEYPDYTLGFSILLVLMALLESLCTPLVTSIQATGAIKGYNIAISIVLLLTIPLSILFIKIGYNAYSIIVISMIVTVITQIQRLFFLARLTGMSIAVYCRKVLFRISIVTLLSICIPTIISYIISDSIMRLILLTIISVLFSVIFIYSIGMSHVERQAIRNYVNKLKTK